MTKPDDGIPYNADQVLKRAYAQIGELMLQRDQLLSAYETKCAELTQARTPQTGEAVAPLQAP